MDKLLKMSIKFHQDTVMLHQKHIKNLQETVDKETVDKETVDKETVDKETVEADMITDELNTVDEYPEFANMNNIWDRIHAAHSSNIKETLSKENNIEESTIKPPIEYPTKIQSDMKSSINTQLPEINDKKYPTMNSLMKYGPSEQKQIQMNIFQQAIDNIDSLIKVNLNAVPNKDDAIIDEADRLLQVWLTTH
jgi:hypothetical protein